MNNYLEGKTDAITVIRTLSGIFNPEQAINILVLICAITRIEQGDLDKDTFRETYLGESK